MFPQEKDNDPNRLFNTRGGQLLKDQKLKQQLKKDLPKVEKELKTALEQWEEDHERYFVISDTRYLDTITRQWEERDHQKEKEKIKRVSLWLMMPLPLLTLSDMFTAKSEGGNHCVGDDLWQQTKHTKENLKVCTTFETPPQHLNDDAFFFTSVQAHSSVSFGCYCPHKSTQSLSISTRSFNHCKSTSSFNKSQKDSNKGNHNL